MRRGYSKCPERLAQEGYLYCTVNTPTCVIVVEIHLKHVYSKRVLPDCVRDIGPSVSASGVPIRVIVASHPSTRRYSEGQGVECAGSAEIRGTDHISLSPTLLDG